MKISLKSWIVAVAVVGVIMGLVMVPTSGAWMGFWNPKVIPAQTKPFGKSYAEWSAKWWQWQLNLPATDHPAFSTDGANCDAGQEGKVWFLTGTYISEEPEEEFLTVVRELCTVPAGKALFFPIINVECSSVDLGPFQLIEEGSGMNVGTCAAKFVKGPSAVAGDLLVEIDGKSLNTFEPYRALSQVFDFSFEDPTDNVLGVECSKADCDNMRAVSDGYWVMVPPLHKGDHTIRFTGSFKDPETDALLFGLDVTYELTVEGGKKFPIWKWK